jgi:tRNA A-37 threonylcarbamoyl transferase component Bud32
MDDLRARVTPHLVQDFDAVREEWTEETGSSDPDRFLAHLVAWGLVPRELQQAGGERTPDSTRRRFRKVGDGLRETGGLPELANAHVVEVVPASNDRYEFVGVIGEGAMGRIELVRDRELARRVAYKRMAAGLEAQAVLARRFAAEARITAQLDHPGIVPVYTVEGRDAYTMKWVDGRTLRGLIEDARSEGGEGPDLLEVFVRVGETIAYAHARGVLHRDLKPENIMVGRFGETWVMDWGIARVFRTDVEAPVEVQHDDEGDLVIGTPGYMSPEQAAGRNGRLGPASDQYALGLVLFEVLARKPAVTGKNAMALVTRNQEGEHDALPSRVHPDLVAIVNRALQLDPARRYASVAALVDDVRRHQRGQPVSVRPEGLVRRALRVIGRRADVLILATVLLVALATTAAIGSVAIVTWRAQRAAADAQATRALLVEASSHARRIEGQMLKFEGLVNVVATLSADGGAASAPPAWSSAFASGDTAPADAVLQSRDDKYGAGPVSAYTPVFVAAAGLDPASLAVEAAGLSAPARRHLPRVLLRSHDERRATVGEAVGRRTVLDIEIPARRAWLWHPAGLLVALPGQEWTADPATLPALEPGRRAEAPQWLPPTPDISGRPVIPVVIAVPYDDGRAGVAGVDLSVRWFEGQLVPEAWRREGVRGFLLDGQGQVVVASDGTAPGSVPFRQLAAVFADRQVGDVGDGDAALLVHPLATSGWWSVIAGDRAVLTR